MNSKINHLNYKTPLVIQNVDLFQNIISIILIDC